MKFNKRRAWHIVRNIFFICFGIGAVMGGLLLLWVSFIKLPDFNSFEAGRLADSTKIYDRTGEIVLYDLGTDARRTSIPHEEMGAAIKNATVAIEDWNFYQHAGIRPTSMIRALLADIRHGAAVQGGSTITQQAIKKSLLSDDKTPIRKAKEIVLALKLEREYTKDEILGIYLNVIPYGGNIFGIQEASRAFLGKDPKDLTLAEAAYLASIPNAPTHFSPYGSYLDDLEDRKNLTLSRERELGFITEEEYQSAKAEKVVWQEQKSQGIKAPHFVFFIKDYLEQKYGADMVESGGLKVITTLDYTMQEKAEDAVELFTLGEKKQINDGNAGLVAIDPKTGQILAMVGSRNYFDKDIDGNFNVTTARRQPGSSFKPYVYATALKLGYTPETVLFDVPTEFNTRCDPYGQPYPGTPKSVCYMPQNYDGRYHGPMTMREALARSMNVPAVKMLSIVGITNSIKTAQDMGITTLTDPSRYGLALVLGGGEVRLLEMTSAYGVFASEGTRHPYAGVLTVTTKNGQVLETWQDTPINDVLPRNVALTMTDILHDNPARTPTFGANSALYFPDREVSVKTGTTNNFKDSWTVGYTPSLVAGVWMGKNNNTSMPVGVTAAPLWHEFMKNALKDTPTETFPRPDPDPDFASLPPVLRGYWQGNQTYVIDTVTGNLATDMTPIGTRKEVVITDVHDILHWVKPEDPRSGPPSNPSAEPLYKNFETAVRAWWGANSSQYQIIDPSQTPTQIDTIHTTNNAAQVAITSPTPNALVAQGAGISVSAISAGTFPLTKMNVFLNGVYVGSAEGTVPIFSFTPRDITGVRSGQNTISIQGFDSIGQTGNASVIIQVAL